MEEPLIMKKPLVLCIMDGFGHNPSDYGNAITAAKTPRLDKLMAECPMTYIGASGMDVGLPDGQMGNSEVGHTNIGAGRVVYQELTRITKSIADGDFFENPALTGAVQAAIDQDATLHLIGLMSDGGVHSHNTHLWALVELAKRMGLKKVFVHCLLDGRDVPPLSLIHISEPTRLGMISYAVFCLKKKKTLSQRHISALRRLKRISIYA